MVELNANLECQVDGCTNPVKSRGYCQKHYQQVRRHGAPMTQSEEFAPRPTECTVDGCEEPVQARGLCMRHYQQKRRTGTCFPKTERSYNREGCSVKSCKGDYYAKGYCRSCYQMLRRYRSLLGESLSAATGLSQADLKANGCEWGTSLSADAKVVYGHLWRSDDNLKVWVELRARSMRQVSEEGAKESAQRLWNKLQSEMEKSNGH